MPTTLMNRPDVTSMVPGSAGGIAAVIQALQLTKLVNIMTMTRLATDREMFTNTSMTLIRTAVNRTLKLTLHICRKNPGKAMFSVLKIKATVVAVTKVAPTAGRLQPVRLNDVARLKASVKIMQFMSDRFMDRPSVVVDTTITLMTAKTNELKISGKVVLSTTTCVNDTASAKQVLVFTV